LQILPAKDMFQVPGGRQISFFDLVDADARRVLRGRLREEILDTGKSAVYDFGERTAVGEPVFAPGPGGENQGWLIS
jgi:carotenoid cleavage dioxygenase-like enzyme